EYQSQERARRDACRPGQGTEIRGDPSMPAALCPGRQGGGEDFPPVVLRQEQARMQEPGSDLPYAGSLLAARNAPSQMLLNTPALFGRQPSFAMQGQLFSYIFAATRMREVRFDP